MRARSWLSIAGLAALAAACGEPAEDDPRAPDEDDAALGQCVDDATFFEEVLWPDTLQAHCASCHHAGGAAASSALVFVSTSRADHLEVNRARLADVAGLEREGQSVVLRKPLGLDGHGGGAVFADDQTEAYQHLQTFLDRTREPVICEGVEVDPLDDEGLDLLDPAQTFRKAAMSLVGRLPRADELARIQAGGESALVGELWALMAEDAFTDVFIERLNDVLLTDRYLRGADAIGTFDDDRYPDVRWYEGLNDSNRTRNAVNAAIAREPLQLAAFILREDRPWTELLTADYSVADPFLRRAWGLADGAAAPEDPEHTHRWEQVRVPGFDHVGLLSTPAFLNRFSTTPTNRNRHRAWFFLKTFLATDVLAYADRPIDAEVESEVHNPTLNDAQCTVCHAALDPVAGLFQAHDERGRFRPPAEGWFPDMAEPGFERDPLPGAQRASALRWLAERAVQDPRFGFATVRMVMSMLTGLELLDAASVAGDPDAQLALRAQDRFLGHVAGELAMRGWDVKYAVEAVVLSRYFRAVGAGHAQASALRLAGTARLLSPEALDRRITATLGMAWAQRHDTTPFLLDRFRLLYGGIDSFSVTDRLRHPNGVTQAVNERLASQLACRALPRDLVLPREQRRLLPFVEDSFVPYTEEGFAIPQAQAAIRRNLQHLHLRLLGEALADDDPELDASYALWLEAWRLGQDALAAGDASSSLDWHCQARTDPWTGAELPSSQQYRNDPRFTARAWMAVLTYLLQDWRFLHE